MSNALLSTGQRPRELRRRVILPARMRSGSQWNDACILNVSSRGLMIQSGRAGPRDDVVEIRRGDLIINARVVWRDGSRIGLQCDDRLPVEEILSLAQSGNLQLVANGGTIIERRKHPRQQADARQRGRVIEFVAVATIALSFAAGLWAMAQQALAKPMTTIEAALAS